MYFLIIFNVNVIINIKYFYHLFSDPDPYHDPPTIDEDYFDILDELSRRWLSIQLTHDVSLKAADEFWRLAVEWMPALYSAKDRCHIRKKVPQFQNQRKKLQADLCPRVGLNFAFQNTVTNEVHMVNNVDKTPLKMYERNPLYTKLYEVAYVKVIIYSNSSQTAHDRQSTNE